MTTSEWYQWQREQPKDPVILRCQICHAPYYSDQPHSCDLPVIERLRLAQRGKREVHFDDPAEIRIIIEFFTQVCHRYLGLPQDIKEIKGRHHFRVGYLWSWRKGWQWTPFLTFPER